MEKLISQSLFYCASEVKEQKIRKDFLVQEAQAVS